MVTIRRLERECDSSLTVSESFSDPQDLSATQDLPRFFHSPARSCSLRRIWSYQHCFLPFMSLVSQNLFQNSEHSPFHAFVPSLFYIFLVDCCMLSAAFHAGSLSLVCSVIGFHNIQYLFSAKRSLPVTLLHSILSPPLGAYPSRVSNTIVSS